MNFFIIFFGSKTRTLLNAPERKNSQTLHFLGFITLGNMKYGGLFILEEGFLFTFQYFIWMYFAHFQDFGVYIQGKDHE